jgi:hypothetical protein
MTRIAAAFQKAPWKTGSLHRVPDGGRSGRGRHCGAGGGADRAGRTCWSWESVLRSDRQRPVLHDAGALLRHDPDRSVQRSPAASSSTRMASSCSRTEPADAPRDRALSRRAPGGFRRRARHRSAARRREFQPAAGAAGLDTVFLVSPTRPVPGWPRRQDCRADSSTSSPGPARPGRAGICPRISPRPCGGLAERRDRCRSPWDSGSRPPRQPAARPGLRTG